MPDFDVTGLHGLGESRWNNKYEFIYDIPPIAFHYPHGVLAGSYPDDHEIIKIGFNDVSGFFGHVCLCGAGGYQISQIAIDLMTRTEKILERGKFTLISSIDHTISDVIAYVLGCSRRNNSEKNHYLIDETIKAPRREYHYYIGCYPQKMAVHIIYRKHLLMDNEQMDKLWKIECSYDKDPASVSQDDMKLYRDAMVNFVKDVLLGRKTGLFEAKNIEYDEFISRLNQLRPVT